MKKSFLPAVRPSTVYKCALYFLCALVLCAAESSFLPRLGLGVTPSLLLCATVAAAYYEDERWASVFGLVSGCLCEAVGSTGFSLLPLLYMLTGAVCVTLFSRVLQRNFGSYLLYTAGAALVRSLVSFVYLILTYGILPPGQAFFRTLLPEFLLTLLFSPAVFGLIALCGLRTRRHKELPVVSM